MENGDLSHYLRSSGDACLKKSLVLDVIQGLVHLHSQRPPVIHADIKPANIFISADGRACIGDYGLSYIKNSAQANGATTKRHALGKTLQYSAPELFDDEHVPMSRSRDIYAFGCVLYEIYSGKPPYAGLREGQILKAIMFDKQLQKPNIIDDNLWRIIQDCRAFKALDRPSANDVLRMLQEPSVSQNEFRPTLHQIPA
ncbi:kinase-like protein, partial [Coniophora puteana RWD-64-598 SS2]